MHPKQTRPTIKDVARAAGVSPTTVSHALSGKRVVNKETADRIRSIAEEIGYRPNPIASGLQAKKFGLISLIIRSFDTLESYLPEGVDYFLRFTGSAALTAMEHGYNLMLIPDPTHGDTPLSTLAADVCIVADPFENDPVLTFLRENRVPLITVGYDPARPDDFPVLDSATSREARLAIGHLVAAGAHRIALGSGTDPNSWNTDTTRTYFEWCVERRQQPVHYSFAETLGEEGGRLLFDAMSAEHEVGVPGGIDGVYCLTGRHAAGFAAAAIEQGIRVPDDLLVLGGSDAVQNRTSKPTVSSIDIQPEATARKAVELAVSLIEQQHIEMKQDGPPALLNIRESTSRA